MFGAKVNGNDVEAVFTAVSQAAERARLGAGPSLLECETYRWEGHSVFTRQEIRRQEEIQLWKERDPIGKYRTKLIKSGQSTGEVLDEIESKVANQISEAIDFAKSSPMPDSDRAFQGTYA
jgi:pyruvate dehydrogenase E1 component alpha subunit